MIDFLGNVKLLSNIFEKMMNEKIVFWSGIPDTRWSDDEEHSVRHSKGQITHSIRAVPVYTV